MKSSIALAALLLLVPATGAIGQSAQNMSISGRIIAASCTLAIQNGGTANIGSFAYDALPRAASDVHQHSITLRTDVACSAPALVALSLFDERLGSASATIALPRHTFGLGKTPDGQNIGGYTVRPQNGSQTMRYTSDFATWTPVDNTPWSTLNGTEPGNPPYLAFANDSGPQPITNGSFDMLLVIRIDARTRIQARQQVQVDGRATMEVTYL